MGFGSVQEIEVLGPAMNGGRVAVGQAGYPGYVEISPSGWMQ
jgi:hypothetical protein